MSAMVWTQLLFIYSLVFTVVFSTVCRTVTVFRVKVTIYCVFVYLSVVIYHVCKNYVIAMLAILQLLQWKPLKFTGQATASFVLPLLMQKQDS